VRSVMLAHCLTAGIPIARTQDYGVVPVSSDWVDQLYQWQAGYIDKIRKDLVQAGLWDSAYASSCRQWCLGNAVYRGVVVSRCCGNLQI